MTPTPLGGFIVDLHSHLVPGVDDGARTIDDSLEGLGRMVEQGIRTVITTPHLDGSLTREPAALEARLSQVDESFAQLRSAQQERHPELTLLRGHEVKLDLPDPDLSDPRIPLGDSDFVLIEWPQLFIPPETPTVLRNLASSGMRLLLAHPERYRGYGPDLALVDHWRREGAYLQVNFGSLVDRYGPEARSQALGLLERGWVDCLSTDFHSRSHLELYVQEAWSVFHELDRLEVWELLTQINPARIARNEDPMPVPPIEPGAGFMDRIRSLFGS